ncbi:MAG: hypothetical protein V4722_15255 [Bacteroidota bacterium]
MKSVFILLLLPALAFSQMKPGRYMIRLAFNSKAIQSGATGAGRPTTIDPCPNPAVNCQNQIWEIKSVRGTPEIFTITKVQNRKCFTFKEQVNDVNRILEDVFMEAQKPQAQIRNQSFIIQQDKDGIYTIQPQRAPGFSARNDVYAAAKLSSINSDGGDVIFETKNRTVNPDGYSNSTNIYWNFIPVTTGTSSVVVTKAPIQSPSVVVAPPSTNKLDIDFKTGGDNLEPKDFQNNIEVRIIVNGRPDIVKQNANNGQAWPNNSNRRVSIPLPADITTEILKEIHIYRTAIGNQDNFKGAVADNWNLDGLIATASIKTDGVIKRFPLLNRVSGVRGTPIFRFVYEQPKNVNEGTVFKTALVYNTPLPGATTSGTPYTSFAATFGTGGDNLEGGSGNNVDLVIKLKGTPARTFLIRNLNNSENWPNFSERTVNKVVPNARFTFADIESIELRHTGGGGIAADNWHIDKFKLTMNINGEARVLIDKVAAPIHMFTGDTRRKLFRIE